MQCYELPEMVISYLLFFSREIKRNIGFTTVEREKSYQKLFLKAPYVSSDLSECVPLGRLLTAANRQ